MAKIESIRPGGVFESNFRDYPFADLLLGVLRANLTGCLDVRLDHDARSASRNHLYFKDGVPISVELPDLGVSVAKLLSDSGDLPRDRMLDVVRAAEKLGMSESKVIVESEILTQGSLHDARRRRAREQVVRLFDAGPTSFVFTEGKMIPDDASLTILQPLPIVFEGLRRSRERAIVDRFLEEHGQSLFKLSATYPHGVDPFEWGSTVEAIIASMEEPKTLADLVAEGLDQRLAEVALAVMFWAGMIELHRAARSPQNAAFPGQNAHAPIPHAPATPAFTPTPRTPGRGTKLQEPRTSFEDSFDRESSGLVVHRRTPMSTPASPAPPEKSPVPAATTDAVPVVDRVSMALHAFRGKSYYKVLRISETTSPDQVERSYRHLLRQLEEQDDALVRIALIELLDEAHAVLSDRDTAAFYRDLCERSKTSSTALAERYTFEAERKVARCLSAMAEGRLYEAIALLDWIAALDPSRRDLKVLRGVYNYFRAPRDRRAHEARILKPLVISELTRSPGDANLKRCAALISEEGELLS